jgi:hypothetical protein
MGLNYPAAATSQLMAEPSDYVPGNLLAVSSSGDALDLGYTADQLSASVISKAASGLTQMGQWSAATALATTGATLGAAPTTEPVGGYYETTAAGTKFGITFIIGDRLLVAQTPAGAKVWSKQQALGDIFDAANIYVAASGTDSQSGTILRPKRNLPAALIAAAQPGTIDMGPGAYGSAGQSLTVTKQNILLLGKGANASNQVTINYQIITAAARLRIRDANVGATFTWGDSAGGHQLLGVGGLIDFAFLGFSTARGFSIIADSDFGGSTATNNLVLSTLPVGQTATLYLTRVASVRASIGAGWVVYVTDCKDFICNSLAPTATLLRTDDLQLVAKLTTQAELDTAKADMTVASIGYYIVDFASATGVGDVAKGDVIFKTISIATGAPVAQIGLHAKYAYAPPVIYGQSKSYYKSGSNAWSEVSSGGSSGTVSFGQYVLRTIPSGVGACQLQTVTGNMPVLADGTSIALKARVTYELRATPRIDNVNWAEFNFVTGAGAYVGTRSSIVAANAGVGNSSGAPAYAIYTPATDTTITLNAIALAQSGSYVPNTNSFGEISIRQIGTTTGYAGPTSPTLYTSQVFIDVPAGFAAPTKGSVATTDHISVVDDGSGWCELTMQLTYESLAGASPGNGIYLPRLPAGAPPIDLIYHKAVATTTAGLSNFVEVARLIPGSSGAVVRSDGSATLICAYAYDGNHFFMVPQIGVGSYNKLRSDYYQLTSAFASQSYAMAFRYKKA